MKKVSLQFAGRDDVKGLCDIEHAAWSLPGEVIEAEPRKIEKRVETGQVVTIARVGGQPAGSQFAFKFNWNGNVETLTTWDDLTANGWTDKVHVPDGNTGFLVGVGVVPKFRQDVFENNLVESPQRISQLLLVNTFIKLHQEGIRHVVGCARIPFYHQKSVLDIEAYCSYRCDDKKLFDPVLRFHERLGAKIIKPVAYAMDDQESLDGGCWVKYDLDHVLSVSPWDHLR
jgi:hypothetical protein